MEVGLVYLLAKAGAALDAAMECVESGGPEWSRMLTVRSEVENMVKCEVNDAWPIPEIS